MNNEITELLYATDFISTAGCCWGYIWSYHFQIDKNGNINVKYGHTNYREPQPQPNNLLFEITDNIAVPDYIIDLYKYLIKTHLVTQNPMGNTACRYEKMEMFFEIVKHLKTSIRYLSYDNDQQTKNKSFLHTRIENIKKIQINTLNNNELLKDENKLLKDENKLLKEKIQQLEKNIKEQKPKTIYAPYIFKEQQTKSTYVKPPIFREQYTNSINTGTLPNATNIMVLNNFTGIYEPGED